MNKLYNSSAKTKARYHTIVEPFREIIGELNGQYWTLAGKVGDNPNAEIYQMISENVCKPEQFYGVDICNEIIEDNKQVVPQANWIHGELEKVLPKYPGANPVVVNIDHLKMSKRTVPCFVRIFDYMSQLPGKRLIIFNTLLQNPYNPAMRETPEELAAEITKYDCFNRNLHKWNYKDYCYVYEGVGKGKKELGTVIFYKIS